VIGFHDYARPQADASSSDLEQYVMGTNMHHALMLAYARRHKVGAKQVIMITDGEPTAH
jgi:uncharacterized protein with von Willebrand factor type A (vWA) domain